MASCNKRNASLSLDFSGPKKVRVMESERGILTSKDLGMLDLTSPELERLIMEPFSDKIGILSAMSGVNDVSQEELTLPTSTKGQQNFGGLPVSKEIVDNFLEKDSEPWQPYTYTTLTPASKKSRQPPVTTEASFSSAYCLLEINSAPRTNDETIATAGSFSVIPTAAQPRLSYLPDGIHQRLKEEPQLVPRLGTTPPLSPINMEVQDRIKQEHKRERNRMAARKCRTKKLEQIMQLEVCVNELKNQNRDLGETAATLRAQMNKLQNQMALHIKHGCKITMDSMTSNNNHPVPSK